MSTTVYTKLTPLQQERIRSQVECYSDDDEDYDQRVDELMLSYSTTNSWRLLSDDEIILERTEHEKKMRERELDHLREQEKKKQLRIKWYTKLLEVNWAECIDLPSDDLPF